MRTLKSLYLQFPSQNNKSFRFVPSTVGNPFSMSLLMLISSNYPENSVIY